MKKILLLISIGLLTFPLFGQVNTDSIFNSAIQAARAEQYEQALVEAKTVLAELPNRADVMVFIANVYSWQGQYDEALTYLDKAYRVNNASSELYAAWLNTLLWSKNYEKLLEVATLAETNQYTDNYNLFYKRTLAYQGLGDYEQGITWIESHTNYLDSIRIKEIYNQLLMLSKKNALSVYYAIDLFDQIGLQPQHLAFIDYTFKWKKNIIIPRLNYSYRFGKHDVQVEADYYRLFQGGRYLYANYGVGINNTLFPQHRVGLEYYSPLSKKFEYSVGGRYLYASGTNIFIATGHLGSYYKNFWFALRPFYVIREKTDALTMVFNTRYFERNPINYWGLELLYGNSPDDKYTVPQTTGNLLLNSYQIKLEKNIALFKVCELKFSAAYAYEEYITTMYRNRFTIETLFRYKF